MGINVKYYQEFHPL